MDETPETPMTKGRSFLQSKEVVMWEASNTPVRTLCLSGPDADSIPEHLVAIARWLTDNPEWCLVHLTPMYDGDKDYTSATFHGPPEFPDDWEPSTEHETVTVNNLWNA
jgi:hypothetical protein